MRASDFVHLHLHSQYSLLDGAIRLKALMARATEYRMPALAITDHGSMYGAIKFHRAAKAAGIKPILGCELYMAPGSRLERAPVAEGGDQTYHLTVLARNEEGYRNLIQLVTRAHLEGFYYRPRVDRELLERYRRGLIAMSGCLSGEINQLLLSGLREKARLAASYYRELFGPEGFYLELQEQGLEEQKLLIPEMIELGKEVGIPLVATNDVHYLDHRDHRAHEVLLCIQTGKTINDEKRLRMASDQFYFKSPGEMKTIFAELPDALSNTRVIAEMCELELEFGVRHHLPNYDPPPGYTLDGYLRKLAEEGLEERLKAMGLGASETRPYRQRLEHELSIIEATGYSGYFLIVWDFIDYARGRGIPVGPGRGSAAGSLVAYALRITDLDPLRYGLLFERFLSPERVSLPDIDIDFCMERREEVIDYVSRRYGKENVAQIITFGTMAARGVVRDVGRALDMAYGEVDRIAKLVPNRLNMTLEQALKEERRLREMAERDERVGELIETARTLEGLTRHASIHAAGVVITPEPLVNYLPLCRGAKGEVVTQYAMDDIEALGLLKMDFLGLRTLTVIEKTCGLIERGRGEKVCVEELPLDDPATYRLLCEAKTTGIFQLESRGIRDILRKLKPESFEDLVALVALYRPGPLGSGMVDDFIKRKHGLQPIEYELPELEALLKETYGVIVYQEQVMNIASELAGFSMGAADELRRAMGKKKLEVMVRQRERFVEGAVGRGIEREKAERLFDLMEYFAGYGFNKSHSAAYALVAYRTAYLKAHYPQEFMAALLTSDRDNTDKVINDITECREMGIKVLPPDVNQSGKDFSVVGTDIRFGLAAVKNVGEGAVDSILEAREKGGPFLSIFDCCRRVDLRLVNRRVVESLIKCGAFDSTGGGRSQLMASVDLAMEAASRAQKSLAAGQFDLFAGAGGAGEAPEPSLPELAEWPESQLLAGEKEALGFYITGHPLGRFERELRHFTDTDTRNLAERRNGGKVRLAGIVRSLRSQTTKRGERMAYVTLEDLYGSAEVIAFPEVYRAAEGLLQGEEPLLVEGNVEPGEEVTRIIAEGIYPLSQARERLATKLHLSLQATGLTREFILELRRLLEGEKGKCEVLLHLLFPEGREVVVAAGEKWRVRLTDELLGRVSELLGAEALSFE